MADEKNERYTHTFPDGTQHTYGYRDGGDWWFVKKPDGTITSSGRSKGEDDSKTGRKEFHTVDQLRGKNDDYRAQRTWDYKKAEEDRKAEEKRRKRR